MSEGTVVIPLASMGEGARTRPRTAAAAAAWITVGFKLFRLIVSILWEVKALGDVP